MQTSIFYLGCFILCSLQSYAQPIEDSISIERTYNQRYRTYSEDATYYGDDKWVFGTTQQAGVPHPIYDYYFPTATLMMTDSREEGKILWQINVNNYEVSWIKDILILENGNIAVFSDYMESHDVSGLYREVVLVSKEGEILQRFDFMQTDALGEDFFDRESFFVEMLELDEENLAIVYDFKKNNGVYKGIFQFNMLDNSLNFLRIFEDENFYIHDAFLDTEKNIFIASNQGLIKYKNQTQTSPSSQPIFQVKDGIAISSTEIIYFDEELQYTQVHDLSASFSRLNFFEYSSDTIWVLGKDIENKQYQLEAYLTSDFSVPLFTSTFGNSNVHPVNLKVYENGIGVVGNEEIEQTRGSFLKTFNKTTGTQQETDIDIKLEKIELYDFEPILTPSGDQFFFRGTIQIKNLGTDTIRQCYLNTYQSFRELRVFLNNFILAPNKSVTIDSLPLSAEQNIDRIKDMCFWITGVNNKLDKDYSNNIICDAIILTNIENTLTFNESSFFQLFPNPTQQFTQIHFENPTIFNGKKVELEAFNLQGQKMENWLVDNGSAALNLDLKDWNSGIYVLQLKVDGEVWAREKLVVLE